MIWNSVLLSNGIIVFKDRTKPFVIDRTGIEMPKGRWTVLSIQYHNWWCLKPFKLFLLQLFPACRDCFPKGLTCLTGTMLSVDATYCCSYIWAFTAINLTLPSLAIVRWGAWACTQLNRKRFSCTRIWEGVGILLGHQGPKIQASPP